jgi:hypothetical protein
MTTFIVTTNPFRRPKESILAEGKRSLEAYLKMVKKVRGSARDGYEYAGPEDFLLRHGKWYDWKPWRRDLSRGQTKACFGNSIILAAEHNWKYVEGYAMAHIGKGGLFPTLHAWNLDENDKLLDSTWLNTGVAYFGVEFSVERAEAATWEGDACVLEDWHRECSIFKQVWFGETPENAVPESRRLRMLREGRKEELVHILESEAGMRP